MRSCTAAVATCALFVVGCAAATGDSLTADPGPQDCTDQEGACVQSGAIAAPDVDGKIEAGLAAIASSLPTHYPFWVLQLNLCNSGLAGCYDGGRSVPRPPPRSRTAHPTS